MDSTKKEHNKEIKTYYSLNRDKRLEYQKDYFYRNWKEVREYQRRYYITHKGKLTSIETMKKRQEKFNRELLRQIDKENKRKLKEESKKKVEEPKEENKALSNYIPPIVFN